ncbi:MAG: cyclic nucleotide-binding domain-containing protein, partial [Thermodesulfobacteriota bacterium]
MVISIQQQRGLEVLKYLNGAVSGLRLYPNKPPQVVGAIDKALEEIKRYLGEFRALHFGLQDGVPTCCGDTLDHKTRERLELFTFFDHLHNLGLNNLVIVSDIDTLTFNSVLSVFTATPDQVKKNGGGQEFVKKKGIARLFPKRYVEEELTEAESEGEVDAMFQAITKLGVRKEYVLYLLGKTDNSKIANALKNLLKEPAKGADIASAAICSLMQALQKKDIYISSPLFTSGLERFSAFLPEEHHAVVMAKSAEFLAVNLDPHALTFLFCQDFSGPLAGDLYNSLLRFIPNDSFDKLIHLLQEKRSQRESGTDANQAQFQALDQACERVMNSTRGKQYQALANTKDLMSQNEQQRQHTRVQSGITALSQGRLESLKNEEVLRHLPGTVENLLERSKDGAAAAIIENIVLAVKNDDPALRKSGALGLGLVGERLVELDQWSWVIKLTPILMVWLRESNEANAAYERSVWILQEVMSYSWQHDEKGRAEQILNLFYYIRSGELEKPPKIRALIGRIQDKSVDLSVLRSYLRECFGKPVDELKCHMIIMQGPVAARFLVDTLLESESRSNRIRLIKLLSMVGSTLPPVIMERLPNRMPWFGKRNLIRLLGETGSEEYAEEVTGYLTHDDLRVQRETISTLFKIGGSQKKELLLSALEKSGEKFKPLIVQLLESVSDKEVSEALLELFKDIKYFSDDIQGELLINICKTLGASGSRKGIRLLNELSSSKEYGKSTGERRSIRQSAEEAIESIESTIRRQRLQEAEDKVKEWESTAQVSEKSGGEETENKPAPPETKEASETQEADKTGEAGDGEFEPVTNFAEERQVYELLRNDKESAAKLHLLDLIGDSVKAQRFDDAEGLRKRLIEIDSTALTEIIKAAEMIEEGMSKGVDKNYLATWSNLYDLLSTSEFNTLYYSLEQKKYESEELVVERGASQYRLFFINKGRIKLYFSTEDEDVLVKTLGPGEILGGETFFNASVWTIDAAAMGNVELSFLTLEALRVLGDGSPPLESSLQQYCL